MKSIRKRWVERNNYWSIRKFLGAFTLWVGLDGDRFEARVLNASNRPLFTKAKIATLEMAFTVAEAATAELLRDGLQGLGRTCDGCQSWGLGSSNFGKTSVKCALDKVMRRHDDFCRRWSPREVK